MDPGGKDACDTEFVWDDYLDVTKSTAAPSTAFVHVEHSLASSFRIGMFLEVANPEEVKAYWIASVEMICGPLLSLRFLGYGQDRSADFWFDVKSSEFHPVGWCAKNSKRLYPPKGVRERCTNYMSLLTSELGANTVPVSLSENDADAGVTPVEQIKAGMIVSVLDEPSQTEWPAKIVQNVGGRLLLRYVGGPSSGEADFWLFYLSERIYPFLAESKVLSSYFPPPGKAASMSEAERKEVLKRTIEEAKSLPFPVHILEPQIPIEDHGFKKGMKLEVLNPLTLLDIRAATVAKVINTKYFIVEVDQHPSEAQNLRYPPVYCHSGSLVIFPCNWAKEHSLKVFGPTDYGRPNEDDFNWEQYFEKCSSTAAPEELFTNIDVSSEFEAGAKLEVVNPFFPDEIHAATIEKIVEPLLWVQFDSAKASKPNHVVPVNSFDLYPVGWCASNGYPLQTPAVLATVQPSISSNVPSNPTETSPKSKVLGCSKEMMAMPVSEIKDDSSGGKLWCPKIYFNHCCFTGPYLSKSRLAELPQTIGPGPVDLVMKDVLTRLINIAYKSSRVLKELQISGRPDPNMVQQTIKAKYKGKSYRATVEFIRNSEQVEEFCRKICRKLECCPHLFGPNRVGQDCPENCYMLTKTKFGHGFLKRQKKPSPSNGQNGSDESPEAKKGPGRRKKRRRKHIRLMNRDIGTIGGENQRESSEPEAKPSVKEPSSRSSDESEEDVSPKKKAKESSSTPAPAAAAAAPLPPPAPTESKIVTRGAKIPNFGLAMQWKHRSAASMVLNKSKNFRRAAVVPLVKKKGRPFGSTKKVISSTVESSNSNKVTEDKERSPAPACSTNSRVLKDAEQIGLPSNPAQWSIDDVYKYIKSTPCAPLARLLKLQEIDGQALMMLTLHSVQEFLHLKLEPAKVLCTLVENLKYEFFTRFT